MPRTFDVLLIEDEPAVQFVMNAALEDAGHRVSIVATRDDAVALLSRAHCFQVVLLDLRLGNERGEDIFLRLLREGISFPPVIILSAQPRSDSVQAAQLIRAANCLSKPTTIEEISAAMDAAVS